MNIADFIGGLVLGAIAGANISFFAIAILVASKEDKRQKALEAKIESLSSKLKTARLDTLSELLERLKAILHEAEMHGNFEPELTGKMLQDVIAEMVGGQNDSTEN